MKIKSNKIDRVFSICIRLRDEVCQWCGREDGTLQCSHIYGRRSASTRWSPLNAKTLCFQCHRRWHENPVEAFRWVEGYLGKGLLDILQEQNRQIVKLSPQDKAEIYEHYKQEEKRLRELRNKGVQGKLELENPM